ncbi:MAG: PepSY domain-containing protein [Methylobacter sp.]
MSMKNLLKAVIVILSLTDNCLAAISLDEATKQIIEGTYNKVLGAQIEIIDGKEVYIIKVLTPDGRIQYVKIDAETGQLVN